MKVFWTQEAEWDRAAIWDYLSARNPEAAIRLDERFRDATAQLGEFPLLGRAGLIDGTRELTPHRRYRIVYEIVSDECWVLALVHTARQWPPVRES